MPEQDNVWLQSLTKHMEVIDAENLLANIEKNRYGRHEKEWIESVLQVVLAANRETFEEMRKEDSGMYDALRDFMAADFQKAENKGEVRGAERAKRETAIKLSRRGDTATDIAELLNVSEKQVEEWLSESLVTA